MISADNLIRKGFLLSPDLIRQEEIDESFFDKLNSLSEKPLIINKEIYYFIKKSINVSTDLSWKEFEKSKVNYEKNRDDKDYKFFLNILNNNFDKKNKTKIDTILEQ